MSILTLIYFKHIIISMGNIKNWLVPTSPQELQSVLRLVSYYHKFIPKFALIVKCSHQLVGPTINQKSKNSQKSEPVATHSTETFKCTGKHQEAFELLKSHLMSLPVLGYPGFS